MPADAGSKVLLEQIAALRRTVDKQSEMLSKLLARFEVEDLPNGCPQESRGRGKSKDEKKEQFTLGDGDEEEGVGL